MPRELTFARHSANGVYFKEWLDLYFDPQNYRSTRCALFDHTGSKFNGDLTYKLVSIEDDYVAEKTKAFENCVGTKIAHAVCLLSPPIVYTDKACIVKQDDDVIFYNEQRTGIDFGWDISMDSDYSRIQNCLFNATDENATRRSAVDNIEVAVSMLSIQRYFHEHVPELQRLTNVVYEMPKMRDTMQKYISCVVAGREFDNIQLETMFNTVIERNRRHGNGVKTMFGILVLMPLIKTHFTTECDPWTIAPVIYNAYKNFIKTLPINDYNKCVVTMGKFFGSVAKKHVHRSLYQLKSGNSRINNLPNYNDSTDWFAGAHYVRSKKVGDNGLRIIPFNIEKLTTVTINNCAFNDDSVIKMVCSASHANDAKVKVTQGNSNCIWVNAYSTTPVIVSKSSTNITVKFADENNSINLWEFSSDTASVSITFKNTIITLEKQQNECHSIRTYNSDVCCICLEEFARNERKTVLPCDHMFHYQCINSWRNYKRSCPLCKKNY